jgi:hypothetical protein
VVSVATASVGLGAAVFFVYVVMGVSYLETFKILVNQAIILVGLAGLIHFLLFGMINKFYLKALRPLNENIEGCYIKPDIGPEKIRMTMDALKRFPLLNTMTAVILTSMVVVAMMFFAYEKTWEIGILMNILLSAGLAELLYVTFTFIISSGIVEGARRQGYGMLRSYPRQAKR